MSSGTPLELEAARRLFGFDRHRCHYAERTPGAPLACRCGAELTSTPPPTRGEPRE